MTTFAVWAVICAIAIILFMIFPKNNNKLKNSEDANSFDRDDEENEETFCDAKLKHDYDNHRDALEVSFSDPPLDAGKWYYLSMYSDKIYKVDLDNMQCSCKFFMDGKNTFLFSNAGRYCKHIFAISRNLGFCTQINNNHELVSYYLWEKETNNYSLGDYYFLSAIDDNEVLIIQKIGSDWVEVFTHKKRSNDINMCTGDIERYGYCAKTNRWAYGSAPYQPMKVKAYIRALPIVSNIDNDIHDTCIEFSIDAFLELPVQDFRIDETLSIAIYAALFDISDVSIIKHTLLKLGRMKNLDKKELALNWLAHGKNLYSQQSQESVFFLQEAIAMDSTHGREISLIQSDDKQSKYSSVTCCKSINQIIEEKSDLKQEEDRLKRESLAIIDKVTISLSSEEATFNGVCNSKKKDKALTVINMNIPEWYDKMKGHTYVGYAYSDFVYSLVNKRDVAHSAVETNQTINYLASLAILDGTVSSNTIAKMYKIKGFIALKFNDDPLALKYFKQAIAYYDKVGVKKIISKLESQNNQERGPA